MVDIMLQNGNVAGDQEALAQVLNAMDRSIDDFVSLVQRNLELFLGQTRKNAVARLSWLTDASNSLNQDFGLGNQKLEKMINELNMHDSRAANVIAG